VSATPDIIVQVRAAGGRVMIIEDRLKVRAPLPLPDKLVAELRLHKAEVLAFLQDRKAAWTPEDWRVFFDERAGIAEHDAGLSRADAEARAYECCIVEWMNRNPPTQGNADLCIHCEERMPENEALPVLTGDGGHVWLHDGCHGDWTAQRRAEAVAALAILGLRPPTEAF
jgi:hypothetical protein